MVMLLLTLVSITILLFFEGVMTCNHSNASLSHDMDYLDCPDCGKTVSLGRMVLLLMDRVEKLEDKVKGQQGMIEDCALDINRLEKKI